MKKHYLLQLLCAALFMATVVSCDEDEKDLIEVGGTEGTEKKGQISADETWSADKIYTLKGRVIVKDGVTLTIEAGTIIKGAEGQGSQASVLIVAQGGKIMAEGTKDKPIVFTSALDNIEVGEALGSNLAKEDNELWGGIIILGKAPISAKSGDTKSVIEGLPADEPFAAYGGDVAADNSGVLKYVSIRHGGITIGAGNEINGLTLGGVGSETTIENIEVYATLDDGVEYFGGTVNSKNVLVTWQGDDGIDIDQNYSGTITNFYVYHGKDVTTDEGLEIDGPENGTYKTGKFTLKNGTIKNDGVEGFAADLKSDAQGTIDNVVFTGYAAEKAEIKVEGEYNENGNCDIRDETDARGNFISGELVVTNSKADAAVLYSKVDDNKNPFCSDLSIGGYDVEVANRFTSKSDATGADASVFGWTATVKSGMTL